MTTPTPEDGCKAEDISAEQMEIHRLRHEVEGLTNAGVVECMVRNRAVFERISELESELAAAKAENAKLKAENSKLRSALELVHFKQEPWQ